MVVLSYKKIHRDNYIITKKKKKKKKKNLNWTTLNNLIKLKFHKILIS